MTCESCHRTENPHAPDCRGVPIFCPLCERDIGPIFPSLDDGRFPAVLHLPDGSHRFDWAVA